MPRCTSCGAGMQDADTFCAECGANRKAQGTSGERGSWQWIIFMLAVVLLVASAVFFTTALRLSSRYQVYVPRKALPMVQMVRCELAGDLQCADAVVREQEVQLLLKNRAYKPLTLEHAEVPGCPPWEGSLAIQPGAREKVLVRGCVLGSLGQTVKSEFSVRYSHPSKGIMKEQGFLSGIVQSSTYAADG